MRKIILFFVVLLFLVPKLVGAHPPSNMELEYDSEGKLLHITMRHVTNNSRKHRIRLLVVYKNGEQFANYYLPHQVSPKGIDTESALDAESGDEIKVQAVCSEAGRKEATLIIP
jgi:hypothetical protein